MTANWVQREALDTNQVVDTTDQILADQDVQEALSIYLVDQLYANVDVQGQLEQELPSSAKALSAPLAAATRQLALNVSEKALASPRVQALVSNAVRAAHEQFVKLIKDKGQYVSTTGGDVTIEYGSLVADLAARLGVDPATISEIQGIVQDLSKDLKQGLTAAQDQIKSVRAELAQVQGGSLSPQLQQDLETLQTKLGRAPDEGREPREEGQERGGEGPVPAPGPPGQARHPAVGPRQPADRAPGSDRRRAQGSQPGERPAARRRARLDRGHGSPPCSVARSCRTRGARRDQVRPARWSSDRCEGAPQPRLRAALAGALAVRGRPLPGAGVASASPDRSGRRDPGVDAARPADEAPDRRRGRGLDGELRDGQAGRPIRLGHRQRRGCASGRCSSS